MPRTPTITLLLISWCAAALPIAGQSAALASRDAALDELIQQAQERNLLRRVRAAERLARLGPSAAPAIETLIVLLGDNRVLDLGVDDEGNILGTTSPGDEAARALVQVGSAAVPALIARLDDPNVSVRRRVVFALALIEDARTVEPLLRALRDPNARVREVAASAVPSNDSRTLQPLIAALRDRDSAVRYEAARTLGRGWAPREAVEPFLKMLAREEDDNAAAEAIGALEETRDPRAVPVLVAVLADHDRSRFVRQWAAAALGAFPGDSRAFDALREARHDDEPEVRSTATRALGPFGDRSIVPELIVDLTTAEPSDLGESDLDWLYERAAAALALGEIRDPRAYGPLLAALTDDSSMLRGASAEALGALGNRAALEPLRSMLAEPDSHVRSRACAGLGLLGDLSAVPAIAPLLDDPYLEVRLAAVKALGQLADAGAVEALNGALSNSMTDVRRRAAEELAEIETSGRAPAGN